MATTESGLCDELKAYCEQEKLPYVSADELILREGLNVAQRSWISQYILRWDAFMDSEAAHRLPLKTALELAGTFVTVLRETVSAEDFAGCMTARCDPDDVCDSNMVMANAFTRLHKRSTWMGSDQEEGRCTQSEVDRDLEVWNSAVEIVRSQFGRVR